MLVCIKFLLLLPVLPNSWASERKNQWTLSHSLAQRVWWGTEKALASCFKTLDNGLGELSESCKLLLVVANGILHLKIKLWKEIVIYFVYMHALIYFSPAKTTKRSPLTFHLAEIIPLISICKTSFFFYKGSLHWSGMTHFSSQY